jgi:hypothetical protein
MQSNQVFINDQGIIEIHVVGDQTVDSVRTAGERARDLATERLQAGKRAMILDNLLLMGTVPVEGRRLAVNLIQATDYDKFAMLGSDRVVRFGANLMLQATGKGSRVKYFEDHETCVAWLLAA